MSEPTTQSPSPFKIQVPQSRLQNLQQRLDLALLPDELDGAEWNYGVPLADIKRLVEYWKDGYNWRTHEAEMNKILPQFAVDIEVEGHGKLNIHFVHKKSDNPRAIPLLFVHGCTYFF